jgi:hypothetical protein
MFRNLNKPDATVARRVAIPVLCVDVNNSENQPYGDSNLRKCGVR